MKKSISILLLLLVSGFAQAQFKMDVADFSAKFKSLFEMGKKRFVTEKGAESSDLNEFGFTKAMSAKTTFNGAEFSRMVVDPDGILAHQSRFKIGTKEEAVKALAEFHKQVKAALPVKFATRETWEDNWLDGSVIVGEYDSDQFILQAKQPSIKLGVREIKGEFYIDLIIFEPVFKA